MIAAAAAAVTATRRETVAATAKEGCGPQLGAHILA
jgi:hypothetical protein